MQTKLEKAMNNNYQVGDYVKWTTVQGEKRGVVVASYPKHRTQTVGMSFTPTRV